MYAYLAALCSERITMNNASKRTPLLLENSLKYCKTPTAKMLQNYAQDYPYPHQFPSHLRQAADFFHVEFMRNILFILWCHYFSAIYIEIGVEIDIDSDGDCGTHSGVHSMTHSVFRSVSHSLTLYLFVDRQNTITS